MAVKQDDITTVQAWSIGASCSVIFDLLTACLMVRIIVHYSARLQHAPEPAGCGLRACLPSASAFSRLAAMVRIVPIFRFVFVQMYSLSSPTYFGTGEGASLSPCSILSPQGLLLFRPFCLLMVDVVWYLSGLSDCQPHGLAGSNLLQHSSGVLSCI